MQKEDFKKMVGEKIKQARLSAGMSQEDLGKAIGLSDKTNVAMVKVYQMEKGVAGIDFQRICLIAKATGKSLYFFAGDFLD